MDRTDDTSKNRRIPFFVLSIAACAASPALGGCAAETTPAEGAAQEAASALTNATLVQPGSWPAVAFLTMDFVNGETHGCTGTLIAPDLVLTAAHCVVCASPDPGSITVQFMAGSTEPGLPGPFVYASQSSSFNPAAFPEHDCSLTGEAWGENVSDHVLPGADVALVRLASPVAGITPVPVLLDPPFGFSSTSRARTRASPRSRTPIRRTATTTPRRRSFGGLTPRSSTRAPGCRGA